MITTAIISLLIASTVGVSGMMAFRAKVHKLEMEALRLKLEKVQSTGDQLLAYNESLTTEGLTSEILIEAIKAKPALVSSKMVVQAFKGTDDLKAAVSNILLSNMELLEEAIDVDQILAERQITHDWESVGTRQIRVPKSKGSGYSSYVLVTDMCRRCRMEHQYFRDGGHPTIDDREGFFVGGKRILTDRTPTCASLAI